MFVVFTTALIAGLIDGINPFALTQQLILQSKIKSPYHILYFIFPIGLGNFFIGLIFYFGFSDWIFQALNWVNHHYPYTWYYLAYAASILIIAYVIYTHLIKDHPASSQEDVQRDAFTQLEVWHLSSFWLIAAIFFGYGIQIF